MLCGGGGLNCRSSHLIFLLKLLEQLETQTLDRAASALLKMNPDPMSSHHFSKSAVACGVLKVSLQTPDVIQGK